MPKPLLGGCLAFRISVMDIMFAISFQHFSAAQHFSNQIRSIQFSAFRSTLSVLLFPFHTHTVPCLTHARTRVLPVFDREWGALVTTVDELLERTMHLEVRVKFTHLWKQIQCPCSWIYSRMKGPWNREWISSSEEAIVTLFKYSYPSQIVRNLYPMCLIEKNEW